MCWCISDYHWLKRVNGTTIKFPPSLFALLAERVVATKAAIITVFPKPISSAKIPPRHREREIGGLRLSCEVNSLRNNDL